MKKLAISPGDRFCRLVAQNYRTIHKTYNGTKYSRILWTCKCDCGNTTEVPTGRLTKGLTRSCGCLRGDLNHERSFKGHEEIYGGFWRTIKHHASERNLKFDITIEQAWGLFLQQNRKCALSNIPIQFGPLTNRKKENTASLDRIDSDKGYTLDNIQWVHKDINKMKQNLTEAYFVDLCHRIVHHSKSSS